MKYVLSTIAFALLFSTHQSAAVKGSGLMRQGPDKAQSAQVDNKAQAGDAATDAAKKKAEAEKKAKMEAARKRAEAQKKAEAANKAQQTPVQPSGGVNDVQLMKPEANADRNCGVAQGTQSQQQSQQQNVDPSQEGGDTLSGNNDSYVPQAQGNDTDSDSKQDDGKVGFFSGGKIMWVLIALAVVMVLFFASRKNSTGRQPKPAVGDGLSDEEKEIAALHESLTNLKAEVEVLKQQNIKLQNDLEDCRKQVAANVNSTAANANVNNSFASTKPSNTVLYANILNGMVFPSDDMQSACDEYTVFVLTVSGNDGTFKVNDAPNAQLYLISNFAYSVASAVEVKSKSASAKTIATVKPGRVRKTGNGWTIVKKAVVELR